MYVFWVRQWYGVDPATVDGLYYLDTEMYAEADEATKTTIDNTIVTLDGEKLTNSYNYAKFDFSNRSIPNLYGGFNFNVGYKGFELSAVFSYAVVAKVLDNTYAILMATGSYGEAMHVDIKDAWNSPGDITEVPRLDNNTVHSTNINQSYSTRWLVSGDYLNLRSVTLSYDLPRKIIRSIDVDNLRLYLSGENLFMVKSRDGLHGYP